MMIRLYAAVPFAAVGTTGVISYTFTSPLYVRSVRPMMDTGDLGTITNLNIEVSAVPFAQFTASQASPDSIAIVPSPQVISGLMPDATPVNRRFNIGERLYVHLDGSAASGSGLLWLEIETGGAAQDASGRDARGRFVR